MTKANITQYSSTPSSNADINDINIAENCPASGLNNAIRELMAHLKNVDTGSQALTALSVAGSVTATTSLKTPLIEFTDGDNALTIADGGNVTANANLTVTGDLIASSLNGGQFGGRRNIANNGAMQVDQRNSGSSYAQINSEYNLDRFRGNSFDGGATTGKFTVQQSSTAPDDFSHSLLVTSSASTADATSNIFNIEQLIEGYNTAHLNFGSSSAKTITLSFYVRSSLTGTFGGALKNSARDRNYPFTYTINSADTFERKTITISGDTSGTWVGSTNGIGLWISFGLGVGSTYSASAGAWGAGDIFSATGATSVIGTSGATWYITGLQLEVGQATPFEHLSFGETLNLCQRYYYRRTNPSTYLNYSIAYGTTDIQGTAFHPVQMRASPTLSFDGVLKASQGNAEIYSSSGFSFSSFSTNDSLGFYTSGAPFSGLTQFRGYMISSDTNDYMEVKAEL